MPWYHSFSVPHLPVDASVHPAESVSAPSCVKTARVRHGSHLSPASTSGASNRLPVARFQGECPLAADTHQGATAAPILQLQLSFCYFLMGKKREKKEVSQKTPNFSAAEVPQSYCSSHPKLPPKNSHCQANGFLKIFFHFRCFSKVFAIFFLVFSKVGGSRRTIYLELYAY